MTSTPPIVTFRVSAVNAPSNDFKLNVTSTVTLVASGAAFFTLPKFILSLVPSTSSTVLLGGKYATVPVSTISTFADLMSRITNYLNHT